MDWGHFFSWNHFHCFYVAAECSFWGVNWALGLLGLFLESCSCRSVSSGISVSVSERLWLNGEDFERTIIIAFSQLLSEGRTGSWCLQSHIGGERLISDQILKLICSCALCNWLHRLPIIFGASWFDRVNTFRWKKRDIGSSSTSFK